MLIIIILIMYAIFINQYNLNIYIYKLFNNTIFKIVYMYSILIIYNYDIFKMKEYNMLFIILLLINYTLTMDYIYVIDNQKLINKIKKLNIRNNFY